MTQAVVNDRLFSNNPLMCLLRYSNNHKHSAVSPAPYIEATCHSNSLAIKWQHLAKLKFIRLMPATHCHLLKDAIFSVDLA